LQLDRVPPRRTPFEFSGTVPRLAGVETDADGTDALPAHDSAEWIPASPAFPAAPSRRRSWARGVMLGFACFSLLGQGEPAGVDPRFRSPSALIATYWEALWANDDQTLAECFADPSHTAPMPGSLWFLPPSRRLCVYPIQSLAGGREKVQASYEIRFRPDDATQDMHFLASTTLVRVHDGWRIADSQEDHSIPLWYPAPRRITI